ncbi:MAG: hypothetical protein HY769_03415 [Candidatus Stahlbacteria bacterium]|nr:hypothetical protein [Candidatus Stahlbacteria bacterium]
MSKFIKKLLAVAIVFATLIGSVRWVNASPDIPIPPPPPPPLGSGPR